MIIYSESFHVEYSIEKNWQAWVKDILIPEVYASRRFSKVIFSKVISHSDETGYTYSLQYFTNNKKNMEEYYKLYFKKLVQLISNKFGTQVLSFKTELEVIETFDF